MSVARTVELESGVRRRVAEDVRGVRWLRVRFVPHGGPEQQDLDFAGEFVERSEASGRPVENGRSENGRAEKDR
jgi:hypothetical protein